MIVLGEEAKENPEGWEDEHRLWNQPLYMLPREQ